MNFQLPNLEVVLPLTGRQLQAPSYSRSYRDLVINRLDAFDTGQRHRDTLFCGHQFEQMVQARPTITRERVHPCTPEKNTARAERPTWVQSLALDVVRSALCNMNSRNVPMCTCRRRSFDEAPAKESDALDPSALFDGTTD